MRKIREKRKEKCVLYYIYLVLDSQSCTYIFYREKFVKFVKRKKYKIDFFFLKNFHTLHNQNVIRVILLGAAIAV